jgi:hypothetical protein
MFLRRREMITAPLKRGTVRRPLPSHELYLLLRSLYGPQSVARKGITSDAGRSSQTTRVSVSDYYADKVNAVLLNDRTIQTSLCYNLPADKLGDGTNAEYAEQLSALVLELGFPPAYASEITSRGDA